MSCSCIPMRGKLWKLWTVESWTAESKCDDQMHAKMVGGRVSSCMCVCVCVRVCVCVYVCLGERGGMSKVLGREEDEDEREAQEIDWGVSQRCNYSSRQGEGEITTQHASHHHCVSVCLSVYVFRLYASRMCFHVCPSNVCVCVCVCVWERHTRTKSKYVGGKRWVAK